MVKGIVNNYLFFFLRTIKAVSIAIDIIDTAAITYSLEKSADSYNYSLEKSANCYNYSLEKSA